MPKASRGVECGEGVRPGQGTVGKFWNFIPGNATFWCILLATVQ